MVTCTTPPFRAAVRLNSGVRARMKYLATLCAVTLLAGCAGRDPLPPLLRGATNHGGSNPCPSPNPDLPRSKERPSEFSRRLASKFPAGFPESTLVSELQQQGFELQGTCDLDQSIHIAKFRQAGSLQNPVTIDAFAYWKSDDHGRITWTRGQVWLTGP